MVLLPIIIWTLFASLVVIEISCSNLAKFTIIKAFIITSIIWISIIFGGFLRDIEVQHKNNKIIHIK